MENNVLAYKDQVRRNLRDALLHKKILLQTMDNSAPVLPPIENPVVEFIENFRKAGGKYFPCSKANLLPRLSAVIQGQKYSRVLNTNAAFKKSLDKHGVRYEEVIDLNYPADAVIVFADILIARTGSVGFTQHIARYVSMKNLAKDLLIVSRDVCVLNELEDAFDYQRQRYQAEPSMIEFLRPTQPKNSNGEDDFQPTHPRFLLFLTDPGKESASGSAQDPNPNAPTDGSQD